LKEEERGFSMSGFEEEDVKKLLLGCIKKPNKQAAALTAELLNQLARKGFFLFFFFLFFCSSTFGRFWNA
jgi:hypothetical protein